MLKRISIRRSLFAIVPALAASALLVALATAHAAEPAAKAASTAKAAAPAKSDAAAKPDAKAAAGEAEWDIVKYGNECAELIAHAPPFNCLDGDIIPITVDGKTPEKYTSRMTCDRPAYLPYPETTDGQCTPYTRVHARYDGDIQMILFCRRMYIREPEDPRFDSLEIIMHNVVTGSTCFFISKNFGEDPNGENGMRVPPPSEETPPPGFPSARDVWATPEEIADHGCIFCHDSDPWMHTPWIAQTAQLPTDPFGFHAVDVGGPFDKWPKPMSISTRGNTCTGCHRIGSLNTCQTEQIPTFGEQPAKMLQSIGHAPAGKLGSKPGTSLENPMKVKTEWGLSYPHSYWMPVGNDLTLDMWNLTYANDVAELERCCKDHDAPGCIVEPIQSKKQWLATEMAAHENEQAKR